MENKNIQNILIGIVTAVIVVGLFIFTIETKRSLIQLFIGCALFLIPIMFLSSFNSKVGSFVFAFFSLIILYVCYKFGFYDLWIGALIAAIIGGNVFYFRVRKAKVFDIDSYQEKAKKHHKNKQNE